jgi:hypothetical protein
VAQGNKRDRFGQEKRKREEGIKKKQKKKQIKHAKLRQLEEEHKLDTDKEEESKVSEEEETSGWRSRLNETIKEVAGGFVSKLRRKQTVWVIDQDEDTDPVAVFKGVAVESREEWAEGEDPVWEVELAGEGWMIKYPIWSIFLTEQAARTVLERLFL